MLWYGGRISDSLGSNPLSHAAWLATLLREPFGQLGTVDADADAMLASHAVIGMLSDFLWQTTQPTQPDVEHIVEFCLSAVARRPASSG